MTNKRTVNRHKAASSRDNSPEQLRRNIFRTKKRARKTCDPPFRCPSSFAGVPAPRHIPAPASPDHAPAPPPHRPRTAPAPPPPRRHRAGPFPPAGPITIRNRRRGAAFHRASPCPPRVPQQAPRPDSAPPRPRNHTPPRCRASAQTCPLPARTSANEMGRASFDDGDSDRDSDNDGDSGSDSGVRHACALSPLTRYP